jgi:glycosyltransferase involved in cell wall biosynthesis
VTIVAPASPGAAAEETLEGIRIQRYRYAPVAAWERLTAPGAIMPNLKRAPFLFLLVPFLFMGQLFSLSRALRREQYDIVHCHWMIPQGLIYALLSVLRRCPPALLTCHGADAFTLNSWPFRLLKRWILGRMTAVTGVSGEISDYLVQLAPTKAEKVQRLPMGVDLSRFRADPKAIQERKARRMAGTPAKLLFAGRLAEKKGVPILLEAFRRTLLRHPGITLRIVGDGPLRADLTNAAIDLIEAGTVTLTGAIPHEQLAKEFSEADLFCAPFVVAADGDREGTPTVLLEAAATGLPIVTTDIGGCRDLIEQGQSGWLVAPGDTDQFGAAIQSALETPQLADRYARAAQERVASFGWEVIAGRHAEILHRILSSDRTSS